MTPILSPAAPPPVPAVVVEGTLNGLGVVRSLSRGGMPIYLLETTARCAARWSRHCHFRRVTGLDGRGLADALVSLSRRLGCRPVLILTGDQSVNSVSEYRALIEPWYHLSLPSHETVRALADKVLFQQLAEREAFPVPRSVILTDGAGVAQISRLTPPLVVKPADKTLVLSGRVERAVRAPTVAEAQRAAAQMLTRASALVVQEWIEGPDTALYFTLFSCDRAGRPIGLFTGRKLVCSPPAIGNTAVCVAAPEESAELAALTQRFIARVGYRGLGSLEFKRDVRSGRFFIIEPTVGRTDWQEELATLCGVNLPLMTYRSELGMAAEPASGPPASLGWCQSAGFRSRLPREVRGRDGFFRWSDPLPGLYYYAYEGILARLWKRLVGAASRTALARASRA